MSDSYIYMIPTFPIFTEVLHFEMDQFVSERATESQNCCELMLYL